MQWLRGLFGQLFGPRAPRSLGQRGEQAAVTYLRRRGFTIVARQHQDRFGELDIVAVQRRTVVFVEVKTRRGDHLGSPAEAVDEDKQRRITRSALAYLRRHRLLECAVRFDVVAVTWPDDRRRPVIQHIPHAFEAVGPDNLFA